MLRTSNKEDTPPGEKEKEEEEEEDKEKGPGVGGTPFDVERLEFYQRRFEDTARVIFQRQEEEAVSRPSQGFLSIGENRRTYVLSNYGNTPVLVRAANAASAVVGQRKTAANSQAASVGPAPLSSSSPLEPTRLIMKETSV